VISLHVAGRVVVAIALDDELPREIGRDKVL